MKVWNFLKHTLTQHWTISVHADSRWCHNHILPISSFDLTHIRLSIILSFHYVYFHFLSFFLILCSFLSYFVFLSYTLPLSFFISSFFLLFLKFIFFIISLFFHPFLTFSPSFLPSFYFFHLFLHPFLCPSLFLSFAPPSLQTLFCFRSSFITSNRNCWALKTGH